MDCFQQRHETVGDWSASVLACNEREARKSNRDGCAPVKILAGQRTRIHKKTARQNAKPGGESQEVSSVIERRMRRGCDVRRFIITSIIEMAADEIWLLRALPCLSSDL